MLCVHTLQRYAETADMIDRSVREPLVETATHKKIQLKKICAFRDSMETFIAKSDDEVAEVSACTVVMLMKSALALRKK